MEGLFSPDSKFMRIMGRVADLMILNLLYLITCIPVFTMGAATTALYTVCFRLGTDRERGLIRSYLEAFKENFKQSTVLWLILLLCGGTALANTIIFYTMPGVFHWCFPLFALLFVLVLLIAAYTFPLLSQFDNRTFATLKNALILSLGTLPRAVLVTLFNIFPVILLLVNLVTYLQAGVLWLLLYYGAAAYVNSLLLRKLFSSLAADDTLQEE